MNIQKFFLAALTAALAAPVLALSTDRDQAIEVHADRFDGDEVKQTAVYTGNVIVDQGSMQITGARLEVRITPKGYRQATVTGEPSRFRQQRDPDPKNPINEWMHARASKIVYDEETDTVTLIGAAYLSRTENGKERDMTEGERIVYDMRNARSKVEGSTVKGEKQRATTIIAEKQYSSCPAYWHTACSCRTALHPPQLIDRPARQEVCNPMANELDDRAHKHTHTLAARGLKKNYGSRQVVKGVDLSVKSGEVVGLLGPNGAGKTTTFYMVVGLVVADGGDIELDGRSIARLPIYKRARLGVSYLPQEASVFRKLSVEDNIRAILEMQVDENGRALDTSEIEHRLEMLLDELQIKHLRTNAALSLSGGERRRTEIARALAANPRFILLDEPFAGVDPIAVIEIQRIVRFLRDRNIGVLITDHNVRETLAICDHAYIINEGRVLASGCLLYTSDAADE